MTSRANHAAISLLAEVAYVESMRVLVVGFMNGRVYAVPLAELEGVDASAVTAVSLGSDGYAAVIEQRSGSRLEVPWDVVLYHAEPEYPFHKHKNGPNDGTPSQHAIGERVRVERLKRHWRLADLSARTGIKIPNLSRLEKGRHRPSLDTLERVAGAFDLSVAALLSAVSVAAPEG